MTFEDSADSQQQQQGSTCATSGARSTPGGRVWLRQSLQLPLGRLLSRSRTRHRASSPGTVQAPVVPVDGDGTPAPGDQAHLLGTAMGASSVMLPEPPLSVSLTKDPDNQPNLSPVAVATNSNPNPNQMSLGSPESTSTTDARTFAIPSSWELLIQKLPREEQDQFHEMLESMKSVCNVSNFESGQKQIKAVQFKTATSALLEQFIETAQTKHQECKNRQWVVSVGGKPIVIRAIMERLIDFAKRCRDIGNIAIQYDPGHAALPWAGFVLILQVGFTLTVLNALN